VIVFAIVPALGLYGGIALYLLAHVALRLRMRGGLGVGRPIAMVLLLALLPVAREVAALASLCLVAAVCVTLIVYEVMRHRSLAHSSARTAANSGSMSFAGWRRMLSL
jgi:hypothetical protein